MTTSSTGKPGTPKPKKKTPKATDVTIRKINQLRLMLEDDLADTSKFEKDFDLFKFLVGRLIQKEDSKDEIKRSAKSKRASDQNSKGSRSYAFWSRLAQGLGMSHDALKKRIELLLLHNDPKLMELRKHLSAVWNSYEAVKSIIKNGGHDSPVTIRIATTNLINMRVLPTVLQKVREKFRQKYKRTPLRFAQTIKDSDELLSRTHLDPRIDVLIACCRNEIANEIPEAELIAKFPLCYCLLCRRSADPAKSVRTQSLRNWDDLPGQEMVGLISRRSQFDVPWDAIESWKPIEEVPTLLEAHARVAASDAWTLSYRELMDDVEEQRLETFDLPEDPDRKAPWIVAKLPPKSRGGGRMPSSKDDGVCNEEQFALELLKTELTDLFKQKEEVRREAQEMTKWLSRFPYSYHVSDYAAKGSSQIQRKWFAGLANLEFTSSGNLSGYFVMGEKTLKVFGRPIPHNKNRTLWHLQWRGVDERSESGSTSMVVKKSDLEFGETLLGSWVGRSSWTADDVRPSGGPFILHSQPNLRPKDLERLVTSLQDEYLPDLRRLSDEMVSIPSDESPESIQGARNPRLTKRPKAR